MKLGPASAGLFGGKEVVYQISLLGAVLADGVYMSSWPTRIANISFSKCFDVDGLRGM